MDTAQSAPPPPASRFPLSPSAALSAGWRAFTARPWPTLGALLVLMIVAIVGEMIPFVNLLFGVLVCPALYAGGAWYFLRTVRGENPPFEAAFEGFQRWPSATGAGLIVFGVAMLIMLPMFAILIGSVGFAAFLGSRPGHTPDLAPAAIMPFFAAMAVTYPLLIWWAARAHMTFFVVMEADRPGAVDAVKRSFALTRGSVWRLVGLYLLWIPVSLLGLLALCVGILPAAVVIYCSYAHAYEQLRARAA